MTEMSYICGEISFFVFWHKYLATFLNTQLFILKQYYNRNMNKNRIRLTESDLRLMIEKAVNEVLREGKVVNNKYNAHGPDGSWCDFNSPFKAYQDAGDFYDYGRKYYPEIWDALVKKAKKEKRTVDDIWAEIKDKQFHRTGSEFNVIRNDYRPFFDKQEKRYAKVHPDEYYDPDDWAWDVAVGGYYEDDKPSRDDRIKKDRR